MKGISMREEDKIREEGETIEEQEISEEDVEIEEEGETIEEQEISEEEGEESVVDEKEEISEVEEEIYYENAVNKGDFVYLEMTGKTEETGEVFDTTDEETAKEHGIFNEERTYGPRLVIVGDGFVLRGLDEKLPGIKFDEESEIEIPATDAFGERNVNLVQTVPYRILRSKGITPYVGAELEIDGRPAIIRSVGAGRVQVDYNHPLAGRNIVYSVRVNEHVTEVKKKLQALIGRRFLGIEPSEFKTRKTKKKIRIGIPDQIFFGENIQIAKRGVALDILRYFEDLETIEYYEIINRT
jgi:FKBP-type peptidyl-prolyl cis-trans isomerase 2